MSIFRSFRRRRIRRRPFPPDWDRFLLQNVPLYRSLPLADRAELQSHILVFLDEKSFEGCAGLKITDEVRLTIAAQACLLLLHRPTNYFPRVITILVYPEPYIAPAVKHAEGILVTESDEARAGEAWPYGAVVLAWSDVLDTRDPQFSSRNLVLHEFAHEIDHELSLTRSVETTTPSEYAPWAQTLNREYRGLVEDLEHHRPTVFHPYGATNLAEVFAVATETFFTSPHDLREHHPDLCNLLTSLYHLDPTTWSADA